MKTSTTWLRWCLVMLIMSFAGTAYAQRNVTLTLNTATLPDTIRATEDIQIRGCLEDCPEGQSALPGGDVIGWSDVTTLRPVNIGGDYWELSFQIPEDETLYFKFYSSGTEARPNSLGGWEDNPAEGDNHMIEAGTGDVELALHYFQKGDARAYDWTPFESKEDSVGVWFRVYMNTEEAAQNYDPEAENLVVALRGGPPVGVEDWSMNLGTLSRESDTNVEPGYHLYSGAVYFPDDHVGEEYEYKFVFMKGDVTYWESSDNRAFVIPDADTTLAWQYFAQSPPIVGELVTANVIYAVDVTPLETIGLFDLARGDTLQARGVFNGWGCGDPDLCVMFREPGTNIYAIEVPLTAAPGSEQEYKFYIHFNDEGLRDTGMGWEEPLDWGGGNRFLDFDGSPELNPGIQYFNDIRPGNVIPEGHSVDLKFSVDVNPALDFLARPFDPAQDSVFVAFEDPVWRWTQGMEVDETNLVVDDQNNRIFFLTDEDGDGIYEGTLTINGPTYNGIGFRYAYGNHADVYTEGKGGFDAGRRRYSYIHPSGGSFPASYEFETVEIGDSEALMPIEDNPTAVSVEPTGGELASNITLDQNYPNPFNPSTSFSYSIDQAQHVRVQVFDILGRHVVTLVDAMQAADTYTVTFDASSLASGTYLYQIQTPSKVISRKMMLVK